MRSPSIDTVSNAKVGHAVISASVTSQTLNMLGITLKAPLLVEIQAPMVIITGNLWVQGGIVMEPGVAGVYEAHSFRHHSALFRKFSGGAAKHWRRADR